MATQLPTSLEIAQEARLRPISEIAAAAGLEPDEIDLYGRFKGKVHLSVLDRLADRADAKLVCVTAITPTKAGEGKTTTSVSLTQGLGHIGRKPVLCIREASLGPVFGIKGGAAGAGYAQVVPMEDMNLHFTGDIHAIGAANNLLAAMLEAHLLHGNALRIDPLSISWRRCVDINDRALRDIVVGLGGKANGYTRQTMSMNFSIPMSAPNPDSVTTTSPSFSAMRSATSELLPWAMFAKGPQWTKAGWPSRVCTRFGLIVSFNSTVIAPAARSCSAVTGVPSPV